MKKVFKYPVEVSDKFSLLLPMEARILAVQMQRDKPCLWALVDPNAPVETRNFRVAGTGNPIEEENLEYIGTFQMAGGNLVWHLFEIKQSQ